MADFKELYYEARAYGGAEWVAPTGTASAPAAIGGVGVRWGGGPTQAVVEHAWGERPRWDLRVEYAGYSSIGRMGVRTAAGLLATRSGARGVPEWTFGPSFDLDVGISPHFELFLAVLIADRFGAGWEPGHATARFAAGIRWVTGHYGIELRSEDQLLYEDGTGMVAQIAFVGRASVTLPDLDLGPTSPLAPEFPRLRRQWKQLDLPTDGGRVLYADERAITLVFDDALPVDDVALNFSRAIVAREWENTFRNSDNGTFTATYSLEGEVLTLFVVERDRQIIVSLVWL